MSEATLPVAAVSREEVKRLRDILHRQASRDLIHTEVRKATLFLQEAVWKDQVVLHQVLHIVVLHQKAAADLHTAADHLPDLTHRVPHHQGHPQDLHQTVAVAVLQEEDSLKQ
jgi:hypothetical protein